MTKALTGALWLLVCLSVAKTLLTIHGAATNVLWVDQWVMLEELWRFHDGRYGIGYLWTPYWRHRIVIPRLLFLADEAIFLFRNSSLIVINVLAQGCSAFLLMREQWRMLRDISRRAAIVTLALTAYLLFSSLQMENFVYGMSVQYTVGYASALATLLLFQPSRRGFWACLILATVSTLTSAAGILLWPMMAFEALVLRGRSLYVAGLVVSGAAVVCVYSIGYSQPGSGMGLFGVVRDPLDAALISAMFLAGPASLNAILLGQVIGALGVLTLTYLAVHLWRDGVNIGTEMVRLSAVCIFLVLVAGSIPLGRMNPTWVASFHGAAPLPSRYFTPPFLFWSSLTGISLLAWKWGRAGRAMCVCALVAVGVVTASALAREAEYRNLWLEFGQHMDAVGTGFLVGAADQTNMAVSYPEQRLLDHWIPYLREHRLSIFSEERSSWIGKNVRASDVCKITDEIVKPVGTAFRVTGEVTTNRSNLAFTDAHGRVVGVGRTIFSPNYGTGKSKLLGYFAGDRASIQCINAPSEVIDRSSQR